MFNIIHQNIQSLRENFDLFLVHLNSLKSKPDIIFLSEIWIYDSECDSFSIPGYSFNSSCNNSYRAGGVAVYFRNDLNCTCSNFNFKTCDVLKLVCCVDNINLTFICFYRIQTFDIAEFLIDFSNVVSTESTKNLVLLGDFNIDLLGRTTRINDVNEYLWSIASFGLESVISQVTRPRSKSCLDHILLRINNNNILYHTDVLDLKISDHSMTSLSLNLSSKAFSSNNQSNYITKSTINYEFLKISLLYEPWNHVYTASNPSEAFSKFFATLSNYISNCTTSALKKKNLKLKPWMTNNLLNLIKKRDKLRKVVKKHPNNLRASNHYNNLCDQIKQNVKLCKENYYTEKLQQNKGNPRGEWKIIDSILNKDTGSSDISLLINGSITNDGPQLCNIFNNHFTNTASKIHSEFNNSSLSGNINFFQNHSFQHNSFVYSPITSSEILKIISGLKNSDSKSDFSQVLSNNILKKISLYIVDVLNYLLNFSIYCGAFPSDLKVATVIPLFKKGSKLDINNYRPISMLPVISTVFEKAMKVRFVSFLEKNSFFSNCQYGFRKNLSTEMALNKFCNEIHSGINGNLSCSSLFIDITKAFDTVCHKTLYSKLYQAGFRGFILDWLYSFLLNRKQVVRTNGSYSHSLTVNVGVPQGSVLGPVLFLIYINSLFNLPFIGLITGFADDISFNYCNKNVFENIININQDLELIRKWFYSHKLQISKKTKIMLYSLIGNVPDSCDIWYHSPSCKRFPLSLNNSNTFNSNCVCHEDCFLIEVVKEFKYLGLIIDFQLNWKSHCLNLRKYFMQVVRNIFNLKYYCSYVILRTFYFALFNSKLQYAIITWGGTYFDTIEPLLIAQKHALRLMFNKNRFEPSYPLFVRSNILPLRHLYYYKCLKMFFNCSGFLSQRQVRAYNLRVNFLNIMEVPPHRTTNFLRYYSSVAPRLFNKLPLQLKNERQLSLFLNKVKSHLFTFDVHSIENYIRIES